MFLGMMKRGIVRIVLCFALFVSLANLSKVSAQLRESAPTFQAGINIGVLPTAEIGFGLSESFTLHVKGTYIPNLFKTPNHFEGWFVAPSVRLWSSDDDQVERFSGYYIEFGLPYMQYDVHSTKLFGEKRPGMKGYSFGVNIGLGYAFKITDNVRITPNLNAVAMIAPQLKYYKYEMDGTQYVRNDAAGQRLPGIIVPLEIGVRIDWVY